jgi:hypothetical protein
MQATKALPPPPPAGPAEAGIRGKSNPFPVQDRALPNIPRRPVGNFGEDPTLPSMRNASTMDSETLKSPPITSAWVNQTIYPPRKDSVPPRPPKHDDGASQKAPMYTSGPGAWPDPSQWVDPSTPKPPQELWKRRPLSNEKNSISNLTLNTGSSLTASPPKQAPLPPVPTEARPIVGLPGRNIRKPSIPVSQNDDAITKTPVRRPPTPDYETSDKAPQRRSPQLFSQVAPETPSSVTSSNLATFRRDSISLTDGNETPRTRDDRMLLPSVRRRSGPEEQLTATEEVAAPPQQPQQQPQPQVLPSSITASSIEEKAEEPHEEFPAFYPPETVASAAAICILHLDCYQSHKFMRSSRNDVCPVECMICESSDKERRWMCNWCSLRCCDSCMKGLAQTPRKELRAYLQTVGKWDRVVKQMMEGVSKVTPVRNLTMSLGGDDILDMYS